MLKIKRYEMPVTCSRCIPQKQLLRWICLWNKLNRQKNNDSEKNQWFSWCFSMFSTIIWQCAPIPNQLLFIDSNPKIIHIFKWKRRKFLFQNLMRCSLRNGGVKTNIPLQIFYSCSPINQKILLKPSNFRSASQKLTFKLKQTLTQLLMLPHSP